MTTWFMGWVGGGYTLNLSTDTYTHTHTHTHTHHAHTHTHTPHTYTYTHYNLRRKPPPRYVLNESGENADRLKGVKEQLVPDISFGW
jgi:hypothetical protein